MKTKERGQNYKTFEKLRKILKMFHILYVGPFGLQQMSYDKILFKTYHLHFPLYYSSLLSELWWLYLNAARTNSEGDTSCEF